MMIGLRGRQASSAPSERRRIAPDHLCRCAAVSAGGAIPTRLAAAGGPNLAPSRHGDQHGATRRRAPRGRDLGALARFLVRVSPVRSPESMGDRMPGLFPRHIALLLVAPVATRECFPLAH